MIFFNFFSLKQGIYQRMFYYDYSGRKFPISWVRNKTNNAHKEFFRLKEDEFYKRLTDELKSIVFECIKTINEPIRSDEDLKQYQHCRTIYVGTTCFVPCTTKPYLNGITGCANKKYTGLSSYCEHPDLSFLFILFQSYRGSPYLNFELSYINFEKVVRK